MISTFIDIWKLLVPKSVQLCLILLVLSDYQLTSEIIKY